MHGNKDGTVTKQEFFDYYTDISTSIASDEYFVEMIESAWMMLENEEDLVHKERVDDLIRILRLKLDNLAKTQDEYMLRKLFHEMDSDKSGYVTPDELLAMLYKLGIDVENKVFFSLKFSFRLI